MEKTMDNTYISLITIMDKNNGIGFGNNLLWKLKDDLSYFKETTTGSVVIMGRKTFESIGKPLPGRINIVLSRKDLDIDGVTVVNNVQSALDLAKGHNKKIFVIGGSEIYKLFLPYANHLHISEVDDEKEADAFFPEINLTEWKEVSSECVQEGDIKYIRRVFDTYSY